MKYEKFKEEIERILLERGRPTSWSEIRTSDKLNRRTPSHRYVQRLQAEIGLIKIKDKKTGKKLWALRRWFKRGQQTFLVPPEKVMITLLCKAKEVISKKYGLTHCLAGLDKDWNWKRLYPLSAEVGNNIEKWCIIEAAVRDFFPEKNRPESVKIWPKEVRFIRKIENMEERKKILERIVETGEFLHRDLRKGKTLGLMKPKFPRFSIENECVQCRFYCDQRKCRGHTMVVGDSEVDEKRDLVMLEGGELHFLLGTHKYHPNKWLLISVINLSKPRQRRLVNK